MSAGPKWEYCRLFVSRPRGEVYVEYFRSPSRDVQRLGETGAGGAGNQPDVWSKSIADLGNNGWELVSVTVVDDPKAPSLYFKRSLGGQLGHFLHAP